MHFDILTKMMIPGLIKFFFVTISVEGLREDRCVAREDSSFEMHCKHKLENVTRIRWEYISATDNKSESIYDSRYNEILKIGFEISCEPQQTLIRTCILNLVKARKEDSGKYICYVGMEGEANIDSNLVERIIEITELVVKGPIHKTIVVNVGDPIILQCEHNVKNLTRARWSHVSTMGVMNYQLHYMDWDKAYHNNYEGLCKSYELSCNLKILEANKESAGKYICMVGESQEFEKKYGMFQMTYFIEIQLVVGDLICNNGMTKDLTMIGENDCYGIEADVLNLKCSFNYFGNINYNLLHLRWIEKYKFNSLEKKLNSSLINHEVKDETKKISIQTNLSVAYEMQNSIFQCILDDTLVKPCQLQEFRIQYVENITVRSPPIYLNDLHTIKCSANKSENVHCSYYWVHEIGGALVQNPYAILPVENMNSPGNYTCIAKCYLGKHKECTIKAMEFEILNIPESHQFSVKEGMITASNVIIFILAVPYFIVLYFFLKKRCLKQRRDNERTFSKKYEIQSTSPLLDSMSTSHLRRRFAPKKVQNEETIESSENPSFPFKVKQILETEPCEDGDVVIYELKHFFHKRVLMVNDAMWDTSCEMTSRLEKLIHVLLRRHQNPKKILIFGTCEGRIVGELLKYGTVESITLGKTNHEEELDKLYHKYFPEMACYLDDPKVHKLNGGIELLKKQQNAFDVIITHVTATDRKLFEYLHSNEYLKYDKSALGEGGIYLLIVSGEDFENITLNPVQHLCQSNCKKYFPVVEYFKFHSFSYHPSCLTRCLLCGPNKEYFSELYEDEIKRWQDEQQWI